MGSVGGVGQTLAWVARVTWVCKVLAWIKKMAWVAWFEILAEVKKVACGKIKWSESSKYLSGLYGFHVLLFYFKKLLFLM